jgi:hypothetical protein
MYMYISCVYYLTEKESVARKERVDLISFMIVSNVSNTGI